jgi:hypothetical protein
MRKLIFSAVIATAFAALCISPAFATITFDFYETGISNCYPSSLSCSLPPQPFVLMSLTVSQPSGHAYMTNSGSPGTVDISDPSFAFSLYPFGSPPGIPVSASNSGLDPTCGAAGNCFILSYSMSWSAGGNVLDAASIGFSGIHNTVLAGFGLSGGTIASDYMLGGCSIGVCTVTGFWQDAPPSLPEPGSMPLLLTALLGLGFARLLQRPATRARRCASGFAALAAGPSIWTGQPSSRRASTAVNSRHSRSERPLFA